jgi:3-oxoacyl-[acyl-carrier protein] reductase
VFCLYLRFHPADFFFGHKALADIDEEFFDQHINANVKGPLFLAKLVAPLLPEGK